MVRFLHAHNVILLLTAKTTKMRTITTCILLLLIAGFNTVTYAQVQRDRYSNKTTVRTRTIVRTPQRHVYRNYKHKRYVHPKPNYAKQTNYISPSKNGYYERRSRNGNRVTYVPVGRRY